MVEFERQVKDYDHADGRVVNVDARSGLVTAKLLETGREVEIHIIGIIGSSADYPREGDILSLSLGDNGEPVSAKIKSRSID